jgi:two-component system chemotaxis response regulator CheB
MESKPLKVLVVDDSAFHRQMIVRILHKHPSFTVIGEAANGGEAIKEVIVNSPDLITLDLEMPGMDGFTFLRWLMYAKPTRTVVVTSRESNRSVFKALELGAVDFMVKPVARDSYLLLAIEQEFIAKLHEAAHSDLDKLKSRLGQAEAGKAALSRAADVPVIARRGDIGGIMIASSTGGPPAVQSIIQQLPPGYPVPICVSQHMPAGFTGLFAKRLASIAAVPVKEAEDGDPFAPGVYIAPGGHHLTIEEKRRKLFLRVTPALPSDRYSPSADAMISSAARALGSRCLAVVLTGMGEDGVQGAADLKAAGGRVLAEHESTCVVYGMPRVIAERGLADQVLPLPEIAIALAALGRILPAPAAADQPAGNPDDADPPGEEA